MDVKLVVLKVLRKMNEVNEELSLGQIIAKIEDLEKEAIHLWLLFLLSENNNSSEITWENISTIPATHFSIFTNMPSLIQMMHDQFSTTRGLFANDYALFSGSHKQYQHCGNDTNLSPLKARHIGNFRRFGELDKVCAFTFECLMSEYRQGLLKKRASLLDKFERQKEAINTLMKESVANSYHLNQLREKCSRIINYSIQENVPLPFDQLKIIEVIRRIYLDLNNVTELVESQALPAKGLEFWRLLLCSFSSQSCLLPLFRVLPHAELTQWRTLSHKVILLCFQEFFKSDPGGFDEYAKKLLDPESMASIENAFDEVRENCEGIFRSDEEYTAIFPLLEDLLIKLEEVASCAEIIVNNTASEFEQANVHYTKRNREEGVAISKEKLNELCRLKNVAYALYDLIGVVRPILKEAPRLSIADDQFFEKHDRQFARLSTCLNWTQSINDRMLSADQPDLLIISLHDAYRAAAKNRLRRLSSQREEVIGSFGKQIGRCLDTGYTISNAEKEALALLNPGWVEWLDKSSQLNIYPDLYQTCNELTRTVSWLLTSIEMTNGYAYPDSIYPVSNQMRINKLRQCQQYLERLEESIAQRVFGIIEQWIERIREAISARETSLEQLMQNFYLLGLFSTTQKLLVEVLGVFSSGLRAQEFCPLLREVSLITEETCFAVKKKKCNGSLVRVLLEGFNNQKVIIADQRSRTLSFVELLCRYTSVNSQESFSQLLAECQSMTQDLEDLEVKNIALEDDLALTDDLLQECRWSGLLEKLKPSFSEEKNLMVQALDNLKAFTVTLNETGYLPENIASFKKVTDFLLVCKTVYHNATTAYSSVSDEINSNKHTDADAEERWYQRLEASSQTLRSAIAQIDKVLRTDHDIATVLLSSHKNLENMGFYAFSKSRGYLSGLLHKMTTLMSKFQQPTSYLGFN